MTQESGIGGGKGGGRGRGGVQVYGDYANVYYGQGMTININYLNQGVGPNHGLNQQAQAVYGGQEVEEAYIAEEEEEEDREQERWERDPIHIFGNNTNVFFGDEMNVTVNHQSQEISNQQAEAETIPQLEASMDTEEERKGRGRGGVQVHGDYANVYYGHGMTININHLNQGVGPNNDPNQQAQAVYGGQEVEEAYIAEEEEDREQERWERDPIHVFGNNTNVFFGDWMNVTINYQSQEVSNQQAEAKNSSIRRLHSSPESGNMDQENIMEDLDD